MAASGPVSAHRTTDAVEWVPNPWRRRNARAIGGTAVATLVSGMGAILWISWKAPRLWSTSEILPPDEQLVFAFLPAAVIAGVTLVLAYYQRLTPVQIGVAPAGLEIGWGGSTRRRGAVPWEAVQGHELADAELESAILRDPRPAGSAYRLSPELLERVREELRTHPGPPGPP